MIPKGKLLIIGGAEDKGDKLQGLDMKTKNRDFVDFELLEELIPERKRKSQILEIITTASEDPRGVEEDYKKILKKLGYSKIGFMNIRNKDDARDPEFIDRVAKSSAVLFSGGDQFRLSTIIGGSPIIDIIAEKYKHEQDFVVAGTSAGAMVMSKIMLYRGGNDEALLKGEVQTASGFGFINCCIIDTHFIKRGRFGRLALAIIANPVCIGIGLGEDTGLIIHKGNEAECRGSGMVMIIDGTEVGHTNIAYAEEDTPICIEGLKVHVLARGNRFLLRERAFIPDKDDIKKEKTTKNQ